MAAACLRFQEIHPIFRISCFTFGRNRCFMISNLKSTTSVEGEKGLSEVQDKGTATGNDNSSENNDVKLTETETSRREHKIPPPEDSHLYDYVRKLEKTVAQGKGTILKSWSRLTKNPRNKNLNVSGGFKSGSLQCLGLTTQLLEKRLNFLEQIGIEGRDALIIAVEFPAILSWDSPNLTKTLQVLTDLNCDIVRLMCRTPYVFGLDFARVTENINKLSNAGVSKSGIGKLVTLHPLILSFPLRDESLDIIRLLFDYHKNVPSDDVSFEEDVNVDEAVFNLLLQPIEKSHEQVNLEDRFKHVVSFLHEMQVSPLVIAAKNPMIFNTDIETLHSAVEFFTSKPLLLEMEVIQQLLISRSEIFVSFDAETMRNRVQLIYDIVQSPTALYNLILVQSSFVFEKSDTKMEDIIQWFRDTGVDDKKMRDLVSLKNFFSLQKSELTEKVEYLLSVKGVTMEDIKNHPACLLKPLTHLKERVEFLNAEKPDALNSNDLGQIMMTKNKEFASEICGSSLEHFTQFLESMSKNENVTKKSDKHN